MRRGTPSGVERPHARDPSAPSYIRPRCTASAPPTTRAQVTAFVWDLCLLAGWQQLQPALAAALVCMRESLLASGDANAVKAFIASNAPSLTIDQLQRTLNVHFMPAIREAVNAPPPQQAFELVRTLASVARSPMRHAPATPHQRQQRRQAVACER